MSGPEITARVLATFFFAVVALCGFILIFGAIA